ncbi:MAG TPA: DUF3618 domain-containing protein [Pilimelia sp.]|nr:DUF3618 domain-containing protein [Pilimelia sp.]
MTSTSNEAGGYRTATAAGGGKAATDPDEIRTEIERTRENLGDTVEALAAKADVKARASEAVSDAKARASEAVSDVKARATEKAHQAADTARRKPMPIAATLAAIAAAVAAAMLIRRRRHAKMRSPKRWRWSR